MTIFINYKHRLVDCVKYPCSLVSMGGQNTRNPKSESKKPETEPKKPELEKPEP